MTDSLFLLKAKLYFRWKILQSNLTILYTQSVDWKHLTAYHVDSHEQSLQHSHDKQIYTLNLLRILILIGVVHVYLYLLDFPSSVLTARYLFSKLPSHKYMILATHQVYHFFQFQSQYTGYSTAHLFISWTDSSQTLHKLVENEISSTLNSLYKMSLTLWFMLLWDLDHLLKANLLWNMSRTGVIANARSIIILALIFMNCQGMCWKILILHWHTQPLLLIVTGSYMIACLACVLSLMILMQLASLYWTWIKI